MSLFVSTERPGQSWLCGGRRLGGMFPPPIKYRCLTESRKLLVWNGENPFQPSPVLAEAWEPPRWGDYPSLSSSDEAAGWFDWSGLVLFFPNKEWRLQGIGFTKEELTSSWLVAVRCLPGSQGAYGATVLFHQICPRERCRILKACTLTPGPFTKTRVIYTKVWVQRQSRI